MGDGPDFIHGEGARIIRVTDFVFFLKARMNVTQPDIGFSHMQKLLDIF